MDQVGHSWSFLISKQTLLPSKGVWRTNNTLVRHFLVCSNDQKNIHLPFVHILCRCCSTASNCELTFGEHSSSILSMLLLFLWNFYLLSFIFVIIDLILWKERIYMKKKLLAGLLAFGIVFSFSSASSASCVIKPPPNHPYQCW